MHVAAECRLPTLCAAAQAAQAAARAELLSCRQTELVRRGRTTLATG